MTSPTQAESPSATGSRSEVRPWREDEGRWSFVTSDPLAEDLARFAHLRN